MPAALDRLINYQRRFFENGATPETALEPPAYTNPKQAQPDPEPNCICRSGLDGHGQNPTCPVHGWWTRDDAALDLADLTRELKSSWDAARAMFGGER